MITTPKPVCTCKWFDSLFICNTATLTGYQHPSFMCADGQWHCIYCGNDNPRDAKTCLVCRIAPASESAASLLKRVRKSARVVSDFTKKDKPSSAKEVSKRWLGRAKNVELVAHQLFADGREKDALKLLTCHSRVCLASRLRPIYVGSLNALATLYMCMGKWEKTEEYTNLAHVVLRGSIRINSGNWMLPPLDPLVRMCTCPLSVRGFLLLFCAHLRPHIKHQFTFAL